MNTPPTEFNVSHDGTDHRYRYTAEERDQAASAGQGRRPAKITSASAAIPAGHARKPSSSTWNATRRRPV